MDPARDLTLVGDASRGAYLIRLGCRVTCHTDPEDKNGYSSETLVLALADGFAPNFDSLGSR